MIVNHDKKFIFTSVPKTGSTTIMTQLDHSTLGQLPNIYHAPLSKIPETKTHKDYFKFGFTRNPLDRFISTYVDAITDPGHIITWSKEALQFSDIELFCLNFNKTSLCAEIHFVPQYSFFYENDACIADCIYRYENFNESCQKINEKLDLKLDYTMRMRQTNTDKNLKKWFTPLSLEIIIDFYKKDFELFNYEIPDIKSLFC